jgi:hypothetical protein
MLLHAQQETATSKATTQMAVFPRGNGFFGIISSNPLLRKKLPAGPRLRSKKGLRLGRLQKA